MRAKQVQAVFKKSLIVHGFKATIRAVPYDLNEKEVGVTPEHSPFPAWSVIVSKKVAPLAVDRNRIRRVWFDSIAKYISDQRFGEDCVKFKSIAVLPKGEYKEGERLLELESIIKKSTENIKWYRF